MSNFYDRIAAAAARHEARPAIDTVGPAGAARTAYGALLTDAARRADWLETTAGVARGDRVALLAPNDARWVAAYLGILRLGAVAVPLDTAYNAAQVETILKSARARLIFTTEKHAEVVAAAATAAHCRVKRLDESEMVFANAGARAAAVMTDEEPAVILYTSGTTADPKGVVITHGNLEAERLAVFDVIKVDERDVVLGVLPLFHALAQVANLLLPLSVGARVVFLESVNSASLLAALETQGVTAFACVPQFFYLIHQRVTGEVAQHSFMARRLFWMLLAANGQLRDRFGWNPGRRIFARVHRALGPNMRWLITGGSRFDPGVLRDLYGMGFTLLNGYGLTETSGGATMVRPADRFTTSVGAALAGVEIRIAPPDTPAAGAERDDGEILIRGPIVMREYFERPDATAAALDDGWLRTGDLGRLDGAGRLYITGRKKEIIVLASGKNLYPEEIEAHYLQSPFIKELCVMGLARPGDPAAERLYAVVVPDERVLREKGIVNVRELIRFELETLSVKLPAHKRLLGFDVSLEPLPRTTTGKLKRGDIERRARAGAHEPSADRPVTEAEREWLAAPARAAIAKAIAERLKRQTVPPDANLELDLGLDSMERVELLTFVEEREHRRVTAEARATIFTVRQLVDAVMAAPVEATASGSETDGRLPWATVLAAPPDPALAANLARPKTLRAAIIWTALRGASLVAALVWGVRVRGRDQLPVRGPFIVSANHQTFFDGFLLAGALPLRAFRDIFFVGAAEFFEHPIMAWGARAINIVPLDPDANLVSAMRAAATGLGLGKVLILFPEGERTIDGTIKPFRKGAAILASHLDVPIVPVGLDGFWEVWPRGRRFNWRTLLPWRAPRVTFTFGAPLRIAPGDYVGGTAALQAAVEQLSKKPGFL